MVFLRVFVCSIVMTGLGAASMEAQTMRAQVIAAPQGRPRVASIAPPPPPPRIRDTYGETIFQNYPVIVTADGRVLVDFGNGYEQVARTCPYAYGYDCQSYGYAAAPQTPVLNYPPIYVPPRYAPPAYGAPVYPTPPQAGNGGCPPGYGPTGSYPPCIDPSRSPGSSAATPRASGVQSGTRAPTGRSATAPRVIHR